VVVARILAAIVDHRHRPDHGDQPSGLTGHEGQQDEPAWLAWAWVQEAARNGALGASTPG